MSQYEAKVNVTVNDSALDAAKKKLDSISKANCKVKIEVDSSGVNQIKSNLKSITTNQKVKVGIDTSSAKASINSLQSDFKTLKNLATQLSQLKIQKGNLELTPSKNTNQINTINSQIKKLESDYNSLYKTFGKSLNVNQLNQLQNIAGKSSDKIALLNSKAKDLKTTMEGVEKPFTRLDTITASNKTSSWLNSNSKAAKKYKVQLEGIAEAQRKATSWGELKDLNKRFKSVTSEAQSLGLVGKGIGDNFKHAFGKIFEFSQIYGGINKIFTATGHAISELKEMDTILTEISKVSNMSSSQLDELGKNAFGYADKYGKTVTSYLEGVTEMNRSGFYDQQGIDLANTSVLAQAAGDMSPDVANQYLLATNAAYEYAGSAQKLNDVLDGQNMINKMVMLCGNI